MNFFKRLFGFGGSSAPQTGKVEDPLLVYGRSIKIPAIAGPFVVRDHLKVNTDANAGAIISDVGKNFQRWFYDLVEPQSSEITIDTAILKKRSSDTPIILYLGGEETIAINMAQAYDPLKRQGSGQSGPLITDGFTVRFYSPDVNKIIREVIFYWRDGAWLIGAMEANMPCSLPEGHQYLAARKVEPPK